MNDHVAARQGGIARLWKSFLKWRKSGEDKMRELEDSMEKLAEHSLYWKRLAESQAKTILDLEAKLEDLKPKKKKRKR